jgi:hypothetical protein
MKSLLSLRSNKLVPFEDKYALLIPGVIRKKLQRFCLKNFFGCCLPYVIRSTDGGFPPGTLADNLNDLLNLDSLLNACGVCALYELGRMKIEHVKIVGRENTFAKKIKDIEFVREAIDLMNTGIPKSEFVEQNKSSYLRFYKTPCNFKHCYYGKLE